MYSPDKVDALAILKLRAGNSPCTVDHICINGRPHLLSESNYELKLSSAGPPGIRRPRLGPQPACSVGVWSLLASESVPQQLRRHGCGSSQAWDRFLSEHKRPKLLHSFYLTAFWRGRLSTACSHTTLLVSRSARQPTNMLSRSLIRLAWMLQHVETLLPMAGEIQAELNSHTAGVSDIHAWGLMLPSSSRVSPVTYHSVVAVRYPDLCKFMRNRWELGSFASGGISQKPPGYQFILWDTNAKINGLVAADLETLVSQVLSEFPYNTGFADGLFVMTTATDHKNNLNRSTLKKDYARTLRVETIANSAGGTAAVAMVAQPSTGFLNVRYQPDGSPTEDTEDCLGRITVGLTRSKSLTLVVSPLDMMGLIGMAQVLATLAYGVHARASTRIHHMGLALLQYESGTGEQQPNGKMVPP